MMNEKTKKLVKEWLRRNNYHKVKANCHDGLLHLTVDESYDAVKNPCDFFELKMAQVPLFKSDILMVKLSFADTDKYVRINVRTEDSYETYLRVRKQLAHERCSYYSGSNCGGCVDGSFATFQSRKRAAIEFGI